MTRTLTVISLVVSLALSASAMPARAGSTEAEALGHFLGAAATLFILGSILDDAFDTPPPSAPKASRRDSTPPVARAAPRAKGDAARRSPAPIPAQCLRRVESSKTRYIVARPCLNRVDYRSARALPDDCRMDMRTRNRLVPGYSMRCLRYRGYTTTDRR